MALHNPRYMFGDFSPEEFSQFFVTARSSVELPPYSGTALYGSQATDGLPNGQDCRRIEFGVNEVIEPSDALPRTPRYSISSTLNPQAPEFILGCTTSQETTAGLDKEVNCSSIDSQCPGSALALDSSSNVEADILENDGVSGGLGQRERKKKKKRPPGYYSYLKDGGEESISPEALVNGHATSAVANSMGAEDAEFMVDVLPSVTLRTCDSPQNSMNFISDTVPDPLDGDARTAGLPEGCHGTDLEQPCLPADSLLRTALAQPFNLVIANGKILEGWRDAANGIELHTVDSVDLDPSKSESASPPAESAVSVPGTIPINQPAKSWASLFHDSKPSSSSPMAYVETKCSPPVPSPLSSEQRVEVKEGLVPVSEDPVAIKIPVPLQPRGLINKGNWCYFNATLQALVACPPMYHLMKFIPLYSKVQRPCTSTPMIDSFVRLMNEFTNMPVPPKPRQVLGEKTVRDIHPGAAFEPTYIYRLLMVIKSSLSEKGRQEDDEEYLCFILNGFHEEMLSLKKLLSPELTISNGPRSHLVNDEEQDEEGEGSEDEWEQVGPRNKTSITCQAEFVQTPITGIFGGHIRSVSFFTLQLDIQSDKIRTVQDALESLVARESVQGYTTKTKQEVEISQRVTLEKLPPILVPHLKRIVYEKTGGCQKLVKNIDYPVDLEISRELLSPGVKNKNFKCHRTYRLFAVVYHHGSSATAGHYTTDVFQIGCTVTVMNQYQVVKPTAEHTAYLLHYRRVDLL
uniref:Ubiquitin carboxyl-terminal hydrolase n=1 Tax=Jaculus jaculus TaxID=51337 RepID=A0A8C5LB43_JACJA